MARNREGLILVLDVGPMMHSVLPEVEKLCSLMIQKKLLYSKNDEVGLVVFGTADAKNELTMQVGGYENVKVLRDIKVVDGDLVDALQQLPRGSIHGDFLDAIVVAMDMLIKKFGATNKGKKRLCLISNAATSTKDPYKGTKEDQVNTLAMEMKSHGMKMECVIVRPKQDCDPHKGIMEENDFLLSIFSNKSSSKRVYVESATSLLGALKTRNISPVTIYRGDFELGPKMQIKVWVYKKTCEEKFPILKKYSDKAPPTDKFATHEVKVDYEYKSIEDPERSVPPEQRIKGFRYGPQVVPISNAEWDAVKFKPEKVDFDEVIEGFVVPIVMYGRQYYMKDVNLFIAEPENTKGILAISALARAMKELNKVAIVRCVWRHGQANVVIGVLTPNLSDNDSIPDSFYFNVLPFAEDVREFQFPSFSNLPLSKQPNEKQQEAADKFVQMLDLAPAGKEEALQPDLTPNPVLVRFYQSLELKSKDPNTAPPPLDNTLRRIMEPDAAIVNQNRVVLEEFHRSFELKENPKLKKSSRRILKEKPSGSSEEGEGVGAVAMDATEYPSKVNVEKEGGYESKVNVGKLGNNESKDNVEKKGEYESKVNAGAAAMDAIAYPSKVDLENEGVYESKVNACDKQGDESKVIVEKEVDFESKANVVHIGDSNPVRDFEAMISRRDDPGWVNKAMNSMKSKIIDLIENSFQGDNYPEAWECIVALRRGCVLEQEPKHFNKFLHKLHKYCQQKQLDNFLDYLAQHEVMLISKTEAPDSDIPENEARFVIGNTEPKTEKES